MKKRIRKISTHTEVINIHLAFIVLEIRFSSNIAKRTSMLQLCNNVCTIENKFDIFYE